MQLQSNRCRNCGGEIDFSKAVNGVIACPFCGSKFTVPKSGASDEVRSFLLMGEHELNVCRFDEAATAFSKAAELDPREPEAFFGLALATAQVQYLKDEVKDCLQPICYSASEKSFVQDTNYKRALSLATAEQKKEYENKGREIDAIREEFNAFRKQGLKYDCFICVKVSEDGSDRHTEDSFIAAKLYKELKNAGFSPFYSEEEVRGRTGVMYEAMILYALYTSGSMLLVCSDESYLQTKWVKNEYSRFLKMQRDEEKARGSLTIVFKGTPVDRIPGLGGRVQGIDFNSFDALNRVLEFVGRFKDKEVRTIKRREYGKAKVDKISATRKGVEKRQLSKVAAGEVTISDRAKLKVVADCLGRRDFGTASNLADKIIEENPANGEAYLLRFLAAQSCTDEDKFIRSKTEVKSYDDFEKALAAADGERSAKLYKLLYQRVYFLKNIEDYEEYIVLPQSTDSDIAQLTQIMYNKAKTDRDYKIFNGIIKTITDASEYIDNNEEFMAMARDDEIKQNSQKGKKNSAEVFRNYKLQYCENILSVDSANGAALWCKFEDEYKDGCLTLDKKVIEEKLFAYGYNPYALSKLVDICKNNCAKQEARSLFEYLLTLIPDGNDGEYKSYLHKFIQSLFQLKNQKVFPDIEKYNDMLLAADKNDDAAYFNKVLIKHKFCNPLQLLDIAESLMSDSDYNSAVMIYAEKFPDYKNLYLDIVDELKRVNKTIPQREWKKVVKNRYVEREELAKCGSIIKKARDIKEKNGYVVKEKWKLTALLLCGYGGIFGLHKFYEGKIGMGILYLCTGGLLMIGWVVDIILLLKKPDFYEVKIKKRR